MTTRVRRSLSTRRLALGLCTAALALGAGVLPAAAQTTEDYGVSGASAPPSVPLVLAPSAAPGSVAGPSGQVSGQGSLPGVTVQGVQAQAPASAPAPAVVLPRTGNPEADSVGAPSPLAVGGLVAAGALLAAGYASRRRARGTLRA